MIANVARSLAELRAKATELGRSLAVNTTEAKSLTEAGATIRAAGNFIDQVKGLSSLPHERTTVYALGDLQFFCISGD